MNRLKSLTAQYRELQQRLEQGGGPDKVRRQHEQGKLTARERVAALLDQGTAWFEVGLLVACDQYDGQAPAAGVVTGLGRISGRPVVVVANDATVKAGSWWPETIRKILRAQEIAMRQRVPIVYLVDSAGVNLPYQGGVFPGQYGAARIFYYNSIMRHYLRVPQIAAVMGPCIAGGAYLPALSDVIFMVDGTSFMGLGGPNLVAVIANSRGVIKGKAGEPPKIGGIIYTESAEKVAYFIANADRERMPLLFVQDVSGFMVGTDAEHSGIIRAGARFVEAMATATVPKLVLTVNHASGAGYYAMAGQGFDPDFIVSWPTGRMGVMEGESAVQAVFGNGVTDAENASAVEAMRADYERQLDARFAGARGFVDAIVAPEDTRDVLAFLLEATTEFSGPHLGAFVLPSAS